MVDLLPLQAPDTILSWASGARDWVLICQGCRFSPFSNNIHLKSFQDFQLAIEVDEFLTIPFSKLARYRADGLQNQRYLQFRDSWKVGWEEQ